MDTLRVRIDKWLWAARFYKTRGLAADEIHKGRVEINGQPVKASREVRVGDSLTLRTPIGPRTVVVQALSEQRGPAPVAQTLYAETGRSGRAAPHGCGARPQPRSGPPRQARPPRHGACLGCALERLDGLLTQQAFSRPWGCQSVSF